VHKERASIDAQGGGLLNLIDPDRAARQATFNAAPWVEAPAEVDLGGVATLQLPAGFRYLSPTNTAALRAEIEPDSPLLRDIALLSAPDHRWTMYVRVIESGLVLLEEPLPNPDYLLQNFRWRHVGLFVGEPAYDSYFHVHYWTSEPHIDLSRQRLDFTVRYRVLDTRGSQDLLSVTRFGRSHAITGAVHFDGFAKMHDAKLYRDEILAAMDAIEFMVGERHTDGDTDLGPARPLSSFIAGLPTRQEEPLTIEAAYDDTTHREESNLPLFILGIVVILVVVTFIPRRSNQ
jgi:hypothetical protein